MASEHEKLVEDAARTIFRTLFHPDESGDTIETKWLEWDHERKQAIKASHAVIALIAERTKAATDAMGNAFLDLEDTIDGGEDIWSAMHAASALWPSHGTDGIEEKTK